ncbi:hypothetical protein BT96DRAFT_985841 [Gymnopus androsaceus JB14]|uniref:Uncharacterized protein n=1 Tax=Gymnopus androsaceus JB14 TaxID=1447944 RepID=A0A6A4ID72_9AGAR|nr:hypothetical protein BT96DRAFT_985841 [Gymnopus androsaceus JB14]
MSSTLKHVRFPSCLRSLQAHDCSVIALDKSTPRCRICYWTHLPKPLAGYAYEYIYATSQKTVPIIAWVSVPSGPFLRIYGPASLGGTSPPQLETGAGLEEARARILKPQAEETSCPAGITLPDASSFEKVKVTGFPLLYAHERSSQISLLPERKFEILGRIYTRVRWSYHCVKLSL